MSVIKRERKKKAISPNIKFEKDDNLTVQEASDVIVTNESESLDGYAKEWIKGLNEIVKQKNESDEGRSKVSAKEWKVAAAAYQTGDYEIDHIASKLGVANVTVSKRFSEMGIKKGETEKIINKKIQEVVTEAHFMSPEEVSRAIVDIKKKTLKYNEFTLDAVMKALATSMRENGTMAAAKDEVSVGAKTLDALGKAYQNAKDILGVKDEDSLTSELMPSFDVYVMTESEELAISNHTNSEDFASIAPITSVSYEDDVIEELDDDGA